MTLSQKTKNIQKFLNLFGQNKILAYSLDSVKNSRMRNFASLNDLSRVFCVQG